MRGGQGGELLKRREFLTCSGAAVCACAQWGCERRGSEETPSVSGQEKASTMTGGPLCQGGSLEWITEGDRIVDLRANVRHPLSGSGMPPGVVDSVFGDSGARGPQAPRLASEGNAISWERAQAVLEARMSASPAGSVVLVTSPLSSVMHEVWARFLAHNRGAIVQVAPDRPIHALRANELVFGVSRGPTFEPRSADTLISLGARFLEDFGMAWRVAGDYADARATGSLTHHVQLEPRRSLTGSRAHEWWAPRPGSETLLALTLLRELLAEANHLLPEEREALERWIQPFDMERTAQATGLGREALEQLVQMLVKSERAVVLPADPLQLGQDALLHHVAVLLLNRVLNAVGTRVRWTRGENLESVFTFRALVDLVERMQRGEIKTLILRQFDPILNLPASMGFVEALRHVDFTMVISEGPHSLMHEADLVLPYPRWWQLFDLENRYRGVHTLMQPVLPSLFPQLEALLLELLRQRGQRVPGTLEALLKQQCLVGDADGDAWARIRSRGGVFEPEPDPSQDPCQVLNNLDTSFFLHYRPRYMEDGAVVLCREGGERLVLQAEVSPVVEMAPELADRYQVRPGDRVSLTSHEQRVEAVVRVTEAVAEGVVALMVSPRDGRGDFRKETHPLHLLMPRLDPQGCLAAGPVRATLKRQRHSGWSEPEEPVPVFRPSSSVARDDLLLDPAAAFFFGKGTPLKKTPFAMCASEFASRRVMLIDLKRCTGCGACAVACHHENSVASPTAFDLAANRAVIWLDVKDFRVLRPLSRHRFANEGGFMPWICQHCADAPCERACPVSATHSDDRGANVMDYQRCMGVRFCAVACPYHVRCFNWRPPQPENPGVVSPRPAGVMEKCSLCLHRADPENPDAVWIPACASVCPTGALRLGKLRDVRDALEQSGDVARAFRCLMDHQETDPGVIYLA